MKGSASKSNLAMLVAFVAAVAAVGLIGSAVTVPAIPGWYAALGKPWFTPPNAAFGPVWSTLYALMAYAGWRAWRAAPLGQERPVVSAFAVQLALNAAWSQLFFGLRRPDLALVDVVLLWAAIAWSIRVFARFDRFAAGLMLPYLAWVSLAVALNAGVVMLN